MVNSVGSLATEKQLQLTVDVAAGLPLGHGDERRITQVLLNLVGNSIKFTDKGEVAVRVSASDGAFLVAVADSGPGIKQEDQEKIFEEFQQSDTALAKSKGGTGLGLAIAKRIVELHGGRIWVESVLGQGSTFFVSLPIRAERKDDSGVIRRRGSEPFAISAAGALARINDQAGDVVAERIAHVAYAYSNELLKSRRSSTSSGSIAPSSDRYRRMLGKFGACRDHFKGEAMEPHRPDPSRAARFFADRGARELRDNPPGSTGGSNREVARDRYHRFTTLLGAAHVPRWSNQEHPAEDH